MPTLQKNNNRPQAHTRFNLQAFSKSRFFTPRPPRHYKWSILQITLLCWEGVRAVPLLRKASAFAAGWFWLTAEGDMKYQPNASSRSICSFRPESPGIFTPGKCLSVLQFTGRPAASPQGQNSGRICRKDVLLLPRWRQNWSPVSMTTWNSLLHTGSVIKTHEAAWCVKSRAARFEGAVCMLSA